MFKAKQLSDPDPDFDRELASTATSTDSVALLAPNAVVDQEIATTGGQKITEQDIDAFTNPTFVFLLFGKMTYKDIFKSEHWTTFCYQAFPLEGRYVTYSAYNDADEN